MGKNTKITVTPSHPGWKWIISFYGKVVTIIMYFIVTTYRNKNGNVCFDVVRYYRNDMCWIRVGIVSVNGNKIRWRNYVTYATKLQNDLWLTIVTKIQVDTPKMRQHPKWDTNKSLLISIFWRREGLLQRYATPRHLHEFQKIRMIWKAKETTFRSH